MLFKLTLLVAFALSGFQVISAQSFLHAVKPLSLKEALAKFKIDDSKPFPRPAPENQNKVLFYEPIRPTKWVLNFGLFRIVRTPLPWRPGQEPYKVSWQRPEICVGKSHCATILF